MALDWLPLMLADSGNEVSHGKIENFVKTRLSMNEYPKKIEFVNDLPKIPNGKIKRKELKQGEYEKKQNGSPNG